MWQRTKYARGRRGKGTRYRLTRGVLGLPTLYWELQEVGRLPPRATVRPHVCLVSRSDELRALPPEARDASVTD